MNKRILLCFGALLATSTLAMAQRPGDHGGRRGRGFGDERPQSKSDALPGQRGHGLSRGGPSAEFSEGEPAGESRAADFGPGRLLQRMPLYAALDTNRDGEISEAEIAAASETLKALDRDKDGALGTEELLFGSAPRKGSAGMSGPGMRGAGDFGRARQGAPNAEQPMRNGEGGANRGHRESGRGRGPGFGDRGFGDRGFDGRGFDGPRFEAAERDVRSDRRSASESGRGSPVDLVNHLFESDADADGFLTESEMPPRLRRLLDRADKDGDGKLSQDEVTEAAERMAQRDDERTRRRSESNGERGDSRSQ